MMLTVKCCFHTDASVFIISDTWDNLLQNQYLYFFLMYVYFVHLHFYLSRILKAGFVTE